MISREFAQLITFPYLWHLLFVNKIEWLTVTSLCLRFNISYTVTILLIHGFRKQTLSLQVSRLRWFLMHSALIFCHVQTKHLPWRHVIWCWHNVTPMTAAWVMWLHSVSRREQTSDVQAPVAQSDILSDIGQDLMTWSKCIPMINWSNVITLPRLHFSHPRYRRIRSHNDNRVSVFSCCTCTSSQPDAQPGEVFDLHALPFLGNFSGFSCCVDIPKYALCDEFGLLDVPAVNGTSFSGSVQIRRIDCLLLNN